MRWSNDSVRPGDVFSLRLLFLTVAHASNDVLWCELRNAKYGLDVVAVSGLGKHHFGRAFWPVLSQSRPAERLHCLLAGLAQAAFP